MRRITRYLPSANKSAPRLIGSIGVRDGQFSGTSTAARYFAAISAATSEQTRGRNSSLQNFRVRPMYTYIRCSSSSSSCKSRLVGSPGWKLFGDRNSAVTPICI